MLDFLKSIWSSFTSGLATVYHFILNAIAAVYSYVNRLFESLARDVTAVYDALVAFARNVDIWVTREVSWIIAFIRSETNAIVQWTLRIYDDLEHYAVALYEWTQRWLDYLDKLVTASFNDLVHWIVSEIWQPLYDFSRTLFGWISKYGMWLWKVVSDPELLVAWIFVYLLKAWLTILRRWAAPIVRWLIRQAYRFIPDIVSLLEEVISKVL